MTWLMIVLRLVHIMGGVLWVGFAVFTAFYLLPTLAEVGPDGGKVVAVLQRRGLTIMIPVLALLTVLSGIWLYLHDGRIAPGFGASPMGMSLGIGGLIALIALIIGLSVINPSMARAAAAAQQAAQATASAEKEALMGQVMRLRARAAGAARFVATLLILAACAMAIGRYV